MQIVRPENYQRDELDDWKFVRHAVPVVMELGRIVEASRAKPWFSVLMHGAALDLTALRSVVDPLSSPIAHQNMAQVRQGLARVRESRPAGVDPQLIVTTMQAVRTRAHALQRLRNDLERISANIEQGYTREATHLRAILAFVFGSLEAAGNGAQVSATLRTAFLALASDKQSAAEKPIWSRFSREAILCRELFQAARDTLRQPWAVQVLQPNYNQLLHPQYQE